jgi:hypothetical protein
MVRVRDDEASVTSVGVMESRLKDDDEAERLRLGVEVVGGRAEVGWVREVRVRNMIGIRRVGFLGCLCGPPPPPPPPGL